MTTLIKRLRRSRVWIAAAGGLAAVALVAAGCGGGSGGASAGGSNGYGAAPSAAPKPAQSAGATTVKLASSKLGKILVDGSGRTLYLFQADKGMASTCSGACAQFWPPLTTSGKPVAGPGIAASKLGTTKRSDGSTEITYNGHPLYRYAGDTGPGQTTGEENHGFGAEWDVLSPSGNKITLDS